MAYVRRRRAAPRRRPVARRPRRYVRRARIPRRPRMSKPDYASLSESRPLAGLSTNTMYSVLDTALNQFPRAVQVAQAYQYFRITGIEFKFLPKLDSFDGATGAVCPYLYFMIDKSGSLPTNINISGLIGMGAKPKRFDNNPVTLKWRPSVLMDANDATAGSRPSTYRISPWLATNNDTVQVGPWIPSTIDHLGLYWTIQQTGAPSLYDLIVTVHFQFKKPLFNSVTPPGDAVVPMSTLLN